jgi:subtilisin family serine protease
LEEVLYWKKRLGLARSDVKLVKSFVDDEYTFEDLMDALDNFINFQEYHLNPSFFPRSPEEPASGYGNVYCAASSSDHGTHVSGIIAASRDNDFGIQGIAGGVCQVMPLRAVPDGDELDKDVANAIRYAVDNGAKVINMSFGKPLSPDRPLVLAAMRHAAENDVLMVHAAGNDAKNTDLFPSHPNPGSDPVVGSCFLSVGASTAFRDEALVASFSNYGATTVDLFAPGDEILSLANDDGTMWMGGTSMAAPVVTGVATLIRAYFPQLSASEVKQILMDSVFQPEGEFFLPGGEGETVPFSALCKSGGVVNAPQAITMAMVQASPAGK